MHTILPPDPDEPSAQVSTKPGELQSAATIDLDRLGLDFVAFCGRAFWRGNRPRRGLLTDNVIFEDTRMSKAEVEHLLSPV
jgi:hypothetical protein